MPELEYTASSQIEQPFIRQPDVSKPFEEFSNSIKSFVNGAQAVAERAEISNQKNQAATDVASGAFKPLSPLSAQAQAYNEVGEAFEKETGRQQLEQTAGGMAQDLISQKVQKGIPLTPDDINEFQSKYNEVANNVVNNASDGNQPYLKNFSSYYGNAAALKIQQKMSDQNNTLLKYNTLTTSDNLMDSAEASLSAGDVNGFTNQALGAIKSTQGTALVLGPDQAFNQQKQIKSRAAMAIGQFLPQNLQALPITDGQVKDLDAHAADIAQALQLGPEDTLRMQKSLDASKAQIAQAQGITQQSINENYKNLEQNVISGNGITDQTFTAARANAGYLTKGQSAVFNTRLNALQSASNTLSQMRGADIATQNKILQDFTDHATNSQDPQFSYETAILHQGVRAMRQQMVNDPAQYTMNTPFMQNVAKQNQTALATQKISGGQMQTSAMMIPKEQAMLQYEKQNGLPQSILPNDQARGLVYSITNTPDFSSGVQALKQTLAPYKAKGVDNVVRSDLLKSGLPVSYTLAMNLPDNSYQQNLFSKAMSTNYQPKDVIGEQAYKQIQQATQSKMSSFAGASGNIDGSSQSLMLPQLMNGAMNRYASALLQTQTQTTPQGAANQAYNDIVGNNYNIQRGLLIPKPYDTSMVMDNLDDKKQQLINNIKGNPGIGASGSGSTLDKITGKIASTIGARNPVQYSMYANGVWLLNNDNTGYVFASSNKSPILDENGKSIEVKLNDMQPLNKLKSSTSLVDKVGK